ncbi:hypothetical protein GC173_15980 [bacterium]|nr:hypothetical protein [bacterium]
MTLRFRPLMATLLLAASAALLGCSATNPDNKLQDEDFIPLRYPQSAMTVAGLGWGKNTGPLTSFRPGKDNVSEELLESMPVADVAFADQIRSSKVYMDVVANPGPELLTAVNLGSAQADAGLERSKLRFLEWGELQEQVLDMQRLSDAMVRGWYNMPGEAMTLDALMAMRPDVVEKKDRPWVVQRCLIAKGMKYGSEATLSGDIGVGAKDPVFGKGELEVGASSTGGSTVNVRKPMVIGYNTAELISVDPPFPPAGIDVKPDQMTTHTFTWKVRGHTGKTTISVDPVVLRRLANRR